MADPSFPPLQLTSVLSVIVQVNGSGSVISTVQVLEQLFASVTVAVYIPADSPEVAAVVSPLLHT